MRLNVIRVPSIRKPWLNWATWHRMRMIPLAHDRPQIRGWMALCTLRATVASPFIKVGR